MSNNNITYSDIFKLAVEQSPNIVFITNLDGNFEYVNNKFTEITGYKLEEIKDKTPKILKSGKFDNEYYKNLWETIKKGNIWKNELENKDKFGKTFWDSTTIIPIKSNNKTIKYLTVKQIITEKKLIKKALVQKEEKFKNVFDFANDTMTIHDFSGKMLAVNKSFCKRLGYTHEEAMKLTPADFDANENPDKFMLRTKEIIKFGHSIFETITICKNGETFYTEVNSRIIDFEGRKAFLGIGRDITKRKKIEFELKKAKEESEISANMQAAFLANMSHEIRTPMNGILGFTDLLRNDNLSQEQREEYIDIITKSGNHLLDLINDIIDVSKIDAGQIVIFEEECKLNFCLLDLSKFFNSIIKEKSNGNVELIVKYGISVGNDSIITDETKLRQIITNLLGNALKFTQKGTITLNTEIINNEFIQFSVKDTGIGISSNNLSLIFERFKQAEKSTTQIFGGTGLGLTISKAYVEMLGGKIWVESELGKGSTFYFTIKYKKA